MTKEYIDRTLLEPDTEWSEYYDDFISYSQSQINSLPTADVIEREKIDNAIEKIDFLRQHKAKYITEDNKICIDSGEVLKILKNIGE